MQTDLKKKVIKGVQWTTISTVTTAVVQMLRLAILARFLEKEDFGLVAIITFVFGLIQRFGDLGFSSAIMHKSDLNKSEFSSLYWIQMIVYFVMFAVMTCLAKPIASFYEEPRIVYLLPISLTGFLFIGIGKLYDTVFQKEFQFKIIAIRNIVSVVLSCILAIVMAAKGFGVYSLIVSILIQHAIFYLWNFIVGQQIMHLRLHMSFKEVKGLVKIGLFQTGTELLNYISKQLDVIIIGKLLGLEVLGIYNLAKDMLTKLVTVINSVANRVALPLFSKIQDNIESMCKNYCRMIQLLTTINFPIIAAIGALSYPITMVFYGERFIETANVMMVLATVNLMEVVDNPSGLITTARGRTDMSFVCMLTKLLFSIPIILITAYFGLNVLLAGNVLISVILLLIIWYFMLWKVIRLSLQTYLATFTTRFVISVVVYVSCFFLVKWFLSATSLVVQLLIGGIAFLVLYTLFIWFFCKDDLTVIMNLASKILARLQGKEIEID